MLWKWRGNAVRIPSFFVATPKCVLFVESPCLMAYNLGSLYCLANYLISISAEFAFLFHVFVVSASLNPYFLWFTPNV